MRRRLRDLVTDQHGIRIGLIVGVLVVAFAVVVVLAAFSDEESDCSTTTGVALSPQGGVSPIIGTTCR